MRILFLTNLLPYPLDNGGKIKTYTTLTALKSLGHVIDLVCFTESKFIYEENKINDICNSVTQVYNRLTTKENKIYMIRIALKSLLSKYSFSILKYLSNNMLNILIQKIENNNYDIIYFDHLQMCLYLDLLKDRIANKTIILDEHNCEFLIMKRNMSSSKNFFKKFFLYMEYKKIEKFESKMIQHVDKVVTLSKNDYESLRKICDNDFDSTIIPIGIQDFGIKTWNDNEEVLNIMFVGTLTWEPNNQGIIWFILNVIPIIERENIKYKLFIIGKNPSDRLKKISSYYKDIIITGYVESLEKYYNMCDCAIVPLFIGSGQRVKIIEAFSKGMPVISTTIGAEGLRYKDGEDICIADTKEIFVEKILLINNNVKLKKEISQKCRNVYLNEYSQKMAIKRIASIITRA